MASSNRLDQRGSTKLARHQQSLLLRARLVGEQKAIAIRPWSHTSVPTVNRKGIYLESNVKWQNMTKDYIISISSGHRCAAVDLGISILLLPPAVLHNQANKFTTGQSPVCEGKSETDNDKGSFKLRTSISSASHFTLFGFFPLIAWVMADYLRSRNLTSDPYKHEVNNFTHFFWVVGLLKVVNLVWKPKSSQVK